MDYDKIAGKYHFYGEHAITDWVLGYNKVTTFLMPLKGKRILDFGCGTGKFSRFLRDHGAKVVGVDLSKKMIEEAIKQDSRGIEYHKINSAGKMSFSQESFDAAVVNFVFCTYSSKAKIVRALKEIRKLLKKDGLVVLLNPNGDKSNGREFISFKFNLTKNLKSGKKVNIILKSEKPIEIEDYYWSKEEYLSMLEQAHFRIVAIQEPTANDSKYKWIDEKNYPPFLIIVGKN